MHLQQTVQTKSAWPSNVEGREDVIVTTKTKNLNLYSARENWAEAMTRRQGRKSLYARLM